MMSRTNYLRSLALLMAAALAVSVLMVLWSTLPVQAQSESPVNDTGGDPQFTGKHLIAFSDDELPEDYAERITALGGSVETALPPIGVVVASGLSEDAADSLSSSEDVRSVDRDMKRQWLDPMEEASAEVMAVEDVQAEVEPASPSQPARAFFYPRQWNMRAITAEEAWQNGRLGSSNVTVAILDTGIDNSHADLQGRVDGTRSKSFVPTDDQLVHARFPNAPVWTDLRYHGTHVAATVSSNAFAAAGVTSKVQLMAVKVLGANGSGEDSGVLAGIMHAADNGADVINMSLGAEFRKRQSDGAVSTINRAINYAHDKGTTIVVSAGNDAANMNEDSDLYRMFCESPHVVCVSATGPTSQESPNGPWTEPDAKASYSNFGSSVTVASPGGNGATNVWAACSRRSLVIPTCRTGHFVVGLRGTSMAAPHASGLAALLVEDIGKGQPSEVASQLRNSADDLGKRGKDANYGHGRINVAKALRPEGS